MSSRNKKNDRFLKTDTNDSRFRENIGVSWEDKKKRIDEICSLLNCSSDKFQVNKTRTCIKNYFDKESHIIYSAISSYVFELDDEQRGNFITNIDSMLAESIDSEKLREGILKIYDHAQLALLQVDNLKRDDNDLKKVIGKNLAPVRNKFNKDLEKSYKEIYSQLIGLIGIFTALAFLVFGSLSALDNIFSNANQMSIFKVVIIACIWGLCITNLIYIFIYFVSELTGLKDKNSVGIHVITAWSNLLLVFILAGSSWMYYVRKMKMLKWAENYLQKCEMQIVLAGFGVIMIAFAISACVLYKKMKKEKLDKQ